MLLQGAFAVTFLLDLVEDVLVDSSKQVVEGHSLVASCFLKSLPAHVLWEAHL